MNNDGSNPGGVMGVTVIEVAGGIAIAYMAFTIAQFAFVHPLLALATVAVAPFVALAVMMWSDVSDEKHRKRQLDLRLKEEEEWQQERKRVRRDCGIVD